MSVHDFFQSPTRITPLASALRGVPPDVRRWVNQYFHVVKGAAQTPISNTYAMLILWYHKDQPRERILDLIYSLHPRVKPATQHGMLRRLLRAEDVREEIIVLGNEVTQFEAIFKGFGQAGYHGVAIHNHEVYPVKFTFEEPEEDHAWAVVNENFMRVKVAHGLMNLLGLQELSCEVLLFGNKDFSGMITGVHVAHPATQRTGITVTCDGLQEG